MREVLEAQAGAEVAPADEAGELGAQVAPQQARAAGDGRVGGVHQRVPVDLVEAHGRPAPEARRGDAVDAVRDLAAVSSDSPSARRAFHACTSPSTISASKTRCWPASALPIELVQPGDVRLRARRRMGGGALDEHRRRHERASDQARPVVVAGRAVVALLRRDAVGQQHQRVDQRVDAAGPGRHWPLPSSHSGSSRSCIRSA